MQALDRNMKEGAMTDLLETVIEAHGGLKRWTELDSVSARLIQGGALWALKGHAGVLDDVFVRASLHQERESHHPFGAPDRAARSLRSASPSRPPRAMSSKHWSNRGPRSPVTPSKRRGPLRSWPTSSAPRCGPTSRSPSPSRCRDSRPLSWIP